MICGGGKPWGLIDLEQALEQISQIYATLWQWWVMD